MVTFFSLSGAKQFIAFSRFLLIDCVCVCVFFLGARELKSFGVLQPSVILYNSKDFFFFHNSIFILLLILVF